MTAIAKTDEQLAPERAEAIDPIEAVARRHGIHPQAMRDFVMTGELTDIPHEYRPSIVVALCEHIGIDPIEKPFMVLQEGKPGDRKFREVLYATRACTSALCRARKISREIVSVEVVKLGGHEQIRARARATMISTGRYDEATGVVAVMQRRWDKQARTNVWEPPDPDKAAVLWMKAETKAKRRAVLDLVGLGITDESEIHVIQGARTAPIDRALEAGREPQRRRRPEPPQRRDEPPPLDVEVFDAPKCAGKAEGLARSSAWRRDLYAELLGKEPGAVWAGICRRLCIDGDPAPEDLTVEQGLGVRGLIKPALAGRIGARVLEVLEAEAKRKPNGSPVVELRGYIAGVTKDARRWAALDDGERAEVLDAIRADASLGGGDDGE